MPRSPRTDIPGAVFHVTIRGIAKRSMFDDEEDVRFYKACLARAKRRGELNILAFSFLHSHVHLLVRSRGQLSSAFQRINGAYTRRFNRRRQRDGALQRGRFFSVLIEGTVYEQNVRAYIDENPVLAGLASTAVGYPWGSRLAVEQGRHRHWLEPSSPGPAVTCDAMRARAEWVGIRTKSKHPPHPIERVDDLRALPDQLLQRLLLADSELRFAPLMGPREVRSAIRRLRVERVLPADVPRFSWEDLEAGLLHEFSGLTMTQIAKLLGLSCTASSRRSCGRYRAALSASAEYRCLVLEVVELARAERGGV
ncbi:MAG: transposase [Planctomycetes bacterium]|nr:transposase [Planctomycetota bacterium]MCB9828849.1 transposase [Planctomycetota bacterium]